MADYADLLATLDLRWKDDVGQVAEPPSLLGMWNRERSESAAAIRARSND